MWQHLFYFITRIIQLYEGDCTILRICWAVGSQFLQVPSKCYKQTVTYALIRLS